MSPTISNKHTKKRQQPSSPTETREAKRPNRNAAADEREEHDSVPDNHETQLVEETPESPVMNSQHQTTSKEATHEDGEIREEADPGEDTQETRPAVDDNDSDGSGHSAHSLSLAAHNTAAGSSVSAKGKAAATLDYLKVTEGTDWGYSKTIHSRIDAIRAFSRADNGTFHVSNLPPNLEWITTSSPTKKNFWTLGLKSKKIPVKIWFIGTVVDIQFFEDDGLPRTQASVNVKMLDDADMDAANNIMRRFSVGNERVPAYPDIRFNKWTSIRRPGETRKAAEIFSDLYDARKGVKLPREKMMFYPPQDLKTDDLVLVEATVQRYHNHKENGKTVYSAWLATFNINFMAILHDSPSSKVDDNEAGPVPELDLSL